MAIDTKYGRVTLENSTIGEDEPVIVFRAQDLNLPATLGYYMGLCQSQGRPQKLLDDIASAMSAIAAWQGDNRDKAKLPD
jgi:hypothetical protein